MSTGNVCSFTGVLVLVLVGRMDISSQDRSYTLYMYSLTYLTLALFLVHTLSPSISLTHPLPLFRSSTLSLTPIQPLNQSIYLTHSFTHLPSYSLHPTHTLHQTNGLILIKHCTSTPAHLEKWPYSPWPFYYYLSPITPYGNQYSGTYL